MPQTITKRQLRQVEGLLVMAKAQFDALESTREALNELFGEDIDEFGHCGDAVYNGYDAKTLLEKMRVTVT